MSSSLQSDSVATDSSWRFSRYGGDTGAFLLLVYLYAWLVVDPHLVHHSLGILSYYYPFAFHTGGAFFREHLARPGGLVEYAVRWLSQFFELGWAGALVLSAFAWHACWCVDTLGHSVGQSRGHVLRYVPAILLLALYGSYSHPLMAILSLAVSLTCFVAYIRWSAHGTVSRAVALVVTTGMLYYVAGSGSLIFPVMVGSYEPFVSRRPWNAAIALYSVAAIPWLATTLFSLDIDQAYRGFLLSDPGLLPGQWPFVLALYLFFPVTFPGSVLARRIQASRDSRVGKRRRGKSEQGRFDSSRGLRSAMTSPYSQTTLLIFAMVATAWFSLDTLARTLLEIDDHCQHERWLQALDAADRMPADFYDVRCHRNVMLALHHTGRLGDEMFRYPQRPGVDLFRTPDDVRDLGADFHEGRFFLEMGHVNQAEKCLCEGLETCGDMPATLELLALINVVKGRPETACIFLNALARHPLERRSAREMLDRLRANPDMNGDPRVLRIRSNMVEKDFVALNTGVEEFLVALLAKNPRNRMAFELLMAHYLVVGRPDGVVGCFPQLGNFSYAYVPRHYQEAAAICARSLGTKPTVPGYELDAMVFTRADNFTNVIASAQSQQQAMQMALTAGFGDSYFFYYAFGMPGLQSNEP